MKPSEEPQLILSKKGILVFTDLDATLLDENYRWEEAHQALEQLRSLGFPVVLSSSKTLDELMLIAEALDTGAPLIAENGALIAIPVPGIRPGRGGRDPKTPPFRVEFNGIDRSAILEVAHHLRHKKNYDYEGFADWPVQRICEETGLSEDQAKRAANRLATEPILWKDTEERWAEFQRALAASQIRAIHGGRFIHLMGNADKALGLKRIVALYRKAYSDTTWEVVSLGDSQNDMDMLCAADIAVVIPNPRRSGRLEPTAPKVVYASQPGPAGWNSSVENILKPYNKKL